MPIPKLIMQTWKTKDVPEKWKSSPLSIKKYHPEWKYVLMTDQDIDNFVKRYFPKYLEFFRSLPRNIQRVDMFRYMWLYVYGGIYIDLDYEALKPFDDLFSGDNDLYLVRTPNSSQYTNSFMASKPGCSFWLLCLEEIVYRCRHIPWYIFGDFEILWTTGPEMITAIATKYNRPFVTIPYTLGHPCSICDHYNGKVCQTEDSYVKELEGSSWITGWTNIGYFIYCRWQEVLLLILLFILMILLVLLMN